MRLHATLVCLARCNDCSRPDLYRCLTAPDPVITEPLSHKQTIKRSDFRIDNRSRPSPRTTYRWTRGLTQFPHRWLIRCTTLHILRGPTRCHDRNTLTRRSTPCTTIPNDAFNDIRPGAGRRNNDAFRKARSKTFRRQNVASVAADRNALDYAGRQRSLLSASVSPSRAVFSPLLFFLVTSSETLPQGLVQTPSTTAAKSKAPTTAAAKRGTQSPFRRFCFASSVRERT